MYFICFKGKSVRLHNKINSICFIGVDIKVEIKEIKLYNLYIFYIVNQKLIRVNF